MAVFLLPQILFSNPLIQAEEKPAELVTEVADALAEAKVTREKIEIITPKGNVFAFSYLIAKKELRQDYDKLSPAEKEKFQQNRMMFLTYAASVLDHTELGIGLGSITRQKIKQVGRKVKNGIMRAFSRATLGEAEVPEQTVRERGHQLVHMMLEQIDERLWERAEVVVHRNETSVSVSVSAMLQGGVFQQGIGGLAGIGVNIGVNNFNGRGVFEIFVEGEWHKYALPFVFSAAIVPKIGVNLAYTPEKNAKRYTKGESAYPPGGYATSCSNNMNVGISTNALGFPSAAADLMCYVNTHHHLTIFSVRIPPVHKNIYLKTMGVIESITSAEKRLALMERVRISLKSCTKLLVGQPTS